MTGTERPSRVGLAGIDRTSVGLAIGDGTAITGFVAIGLYHHHVNPFAFPVHTIRTALPFLLGWFLMAAVVGLYDRRRPVGIRSTVATVLLTWGVGSVFGAIIRASPALPGGAPLDFVAVNLVLGAAILIPWRIAVEIGRSYEV